MSVGHCHCPCADWGHDGGACTGRADTALPVSRTQDGHTAQPVCRYCHTEISSVSDRGVIAPRRP